MPMVLKRDLHDRIADPHHIKQGEMAGGVIVLPMRQRIFLMTSSADVNEQGNLKLIRAMTVQ